MKDLLKIKLSDVLSSTLLIGMLALLLIVVSWSGGVLNDIKDFDVIKNSTSKISSTMQDMNSTKMFTFSKNKIASGYKFSISKGSELKNYISSSTLNPFKSDINASIDVNDSIVTQLPKNKFALMDLNKTQQTAVLSKAIIEHNSSKQKGIK